MAHLANFKRGALSHMFDHYSREEGDGVDRSNENIDSSKTHLNYARWFTDVEGIDDGRTLAAAYRERIREAVAATNAKRAAEGRKSLYKSSAVMSCWCVTLPSDCPEDKTKDFFKFALRFCRKRYGKNVLGCFVHMDETTPHAHIPLLLTLDDGTIDKGKVLPRKDLQTFHSDLQKYMDDNLGCHVSVLLDEDDLVGKAKSKLTRKELDALNADIRASVDAETAVEREKLEEQENTLKEEEISLKRRKKACDDKERSLDEREKQVEKREEGLSALANEMNAAWIGLKKDMRDFVDRTFDEVSEERELEQRKRAFLAKFQDEVEQDDHYKSLDTSTYSPEF